MFVTYYSSKSGHDSIYKKSSIPDRYVAIGIDKYIYGEKTKEIVPLDDVFQMIINDISDRITILLAYTAVYQSGHNITISSNNLNIVITDNIVEVAKLVKKNQKIRTTIINLQDYTKDKLYEAMFAI